MSVRNELVTRLLGVLVSYTLLFSGIDENTTYQLP